MIKTRRQGPLSISAAADHGTWFDTISHTRKHLVAGELARAQNLAEPVATLYYYPIPGRRRSNTTLLSRLHAGTRGMHLPR